MLHVTALHLGVNSPYKYTDSFLSSSSSSSSHNGITLRLSQEREREREREMELQYGARLMAQQYTALLRKNAILTWRQKRSAFLQLFSSLFFIFLIFCID